MGITYANDAVTVTGGSQDEPYTMADLDADMTVGGYVTAGGYGSKEYSVSKDLVIGSEDADTFFDPTRSIVKMADGYKLTVYSHALRGGNLCDSWAAVKFGAEKGPIEDRDWNLRTENVIMMYPRMEAMICRATGDIIPANNPIPVLNPSPLGQPQTLAQQDAGTEWDPCAPVDWAAIRSATPVTGFGQPAFGPPVVQEAFPFWLEPVAAPAAPEARRNAPKLEIVFVLCNADLCG